jgi:glucosamine-phosphate N-acetyltransferase
MEGVKQVHIRKLQKEDVSPHGDFIRILEQLSASDNFKRAACNYSTLWDQYARQTHTHVVVALVDPIEMLSSRPWNDRVVIGTGSIFIEQKFLRAGGIVGHLEDIVVDKTTRLSGVGRMIVNHLVEIAKDNSCYKVILNCSDHNVDFYNKCGFRWSGNEMRVNLD